jgi:ABC-type cobalt transport system substrate-binding protein
MNTKHLLVTAAVFLLALEGACRAQSPGVCDALPYRAFDFWLGDWDVFDVATNVKSAHVRVSSVEGQCGLREKYTAVDGSAGESLSTYDPSHQTWRQFWVSNTGEIVSIAGTLQGGSMVLVGSEEGAHSSMVRGIWKPEPGGVRETGEKSQDNGRSWKPWFDLHFRRVQDACDPIHKGPDR